MCLAGLGPWLGDNWKEGSLGQVRSSGGSKICWQGEGCWAKEQEWVGRRTQGCSGGRNVSWESGEDMLDVWDGKAAPSLYNFWLGVFQGGGLGGGHFSSWWEARTEASRCGCRAEGQTWVRPDAPSSTSSPTFLNWGPWVLKGSGFHCPVLPVTHRTLSVRRSVLSLWTFQVV